MNNGNTKPVTFRLDAALLSAIEQQLAPRPWGNHFATPTPDLRSYTARA